MSKHITAQRIVDLLAERHAKDVFVPECNTGSSWSGCQRFDAWAMKKSWSPLTVIGYEIKVTRSDFDRDEKWEGYLPFCHRFSFVCPAGLIKTDDLPKHVGLIWVSANGKRLHTRRKAPMHEADSQALYEIMAYVLMSRSRIVANMHEANRADPPDPLDEYRRSVELAEKRGELADFIRGHIRQRYDEMRGEVESARRVKNDADALQEALAANGIDWSDREGWGSWETRCQIEALSGRIPHGVDRAIAGVRRQLDGLEKEIAEIRGKSNDATHRR